MNFFLSINKRSLIGRNHVGIKKRIQQEIKVFKLDIQVNQSGLRVSKFPTEVKQIF